MNQAHLIYYGGYQNIYLTVENIWSKPPYAKAIMYINLYQIHVYFLNYNEIYEYQK